VVGREKNASRMRGEMKGGRNAKRNFTELRVERNRGRANQTKGVYTVRLRLGGREHECGLDSEKWGKR